MSSSHIYSQIGQKLFSPFPDPPCRPVRPAGCGETVLAKATFPGHHHHQGDSISLLTSHIFATVEHICKMFLPRMGTHPHTSQQNVAPLASCKNCSNLTRTSSPQAGLIVKLLEMFKTLIFPEHFCCRNRITDSTPLHVATEGGHTDVVKLLISCGASPLDENKVFWTVFWFWS